MSQLPMYPGQPNSPQTELSDAIDSTQTTVPVVDASALPDAPNLITIGAGPNAETILYMTKSGNNLEDCARGFNDTPASSWPAGQKVARYFTAYDYDALRQNLIAHLDDYEQNAIKRDGSVAMSGDLEIDKNTPYINLEHNSSGTSINGGILARNKEQDIWRVGRSSGNGVFVLESFVNAIDFRSANSRYLFRGPSDSVATISVHDGHPEGSVGAGIGSLCLRTDGGSHGKLYVKTSGTGNTGWLEVQTV